MSASGTDERPDRRILTPSSLNRLARDLIEGALPLVWIEGELSNVSRPASGHLYFTLKDSTAQVRGAMFKPRSSWLPFKPVDGMQVLLRTRVSLYEARGEFQLVAEHMEPAGEGALRREFEQRKARLAAEGLFEPTRKRALPAWPRRIGIITSPTGAAVRDVIHVLARRFALVDVEILPVPVQGKEAPAAIISALQAASAAQRHDVLLLTRGGGSLEDLWAFNDEGIARAIAASRIPVIAAIGHEIDFTIADFVADLRAPTPSAAAELLVPDRNEVSRTLRRQHERLVQHVRTRIEGTSQHIDHLFARLQAGRPSARIARARERLHTLRIRLTQVARHDAERRAARASHVHARLLAVHPRLRVAVARDRLAALERAQRRAVVQAIETRRARLGAIVRTLHATSPLATLGRGYAILIDRASGGVVRSAQDATPGQALRAMLADGELDLRVEVRD